MSNQQLGALAIMMVGATAMMFIVATVIQDPAVSEAKLGIGMGFFSGITAGVVGSKVMGSLFNKKDS